MTRPVMPTPAEIAEPCGGCGVAIPPRYQRMDRDLPVVTALYTCDDCRRVWKSTYLDVEEPQR